ncbi:hypothetical protein [Limosilactobacillus sp.]|uniref:hypothetical protein n=1 Tax=Limosilactobacillus sp. TaxID=2773925 RepID=UPI00345EEADA
MKMKLHQRLLAGALVIALTLTATACGKQAQSVSSTSSSQTKTSAASPSAKAYRDAKKLIKEGRYQTAMDRLNDVANPSQRVQNLKGDLQSYLKAQKAYDGHDYQGAVSALNNRQSNNQRLNSAMDTLSARASGAANGGQVATSNSSQTTPKNTKANSSSSSSSSQSSQVSEDQAVVDFATKMGFTGSDYQIITQSSSGQNFHFEVRRNNSDNTVANMVGIYSYNSQTGTVSKIS